MSTYPYRLCIYCCACRGLIHADHNNIFYEFRKEWGRFEKALYLPAKRLEDTYFHPDREELWMTLYRLIIRDPRRSRQGDEYRLSGIAQFTHQVEDAFRVPRDRNAAILGHPDPHSWTPSVKIDAVFLARDLPIASSPDSKWKAPGRNGLHGYPVHARCWSLIERIVGAANVEKHLELLMQALRRRFRHRIGPPPVYWGFECCSEESHVHQDPVRIVAVRNLLKTAAQEVHVHVPIKRHSTRQASRRSAALDWCPFGRFRIHLPLEIQYLILHWLDRRDINALHEAFSGTASEWRLPDSYWMRRAHRFFPIYEIQDLLDRTRNSTGAGTDRRVEVDWEYLCLEGEELIQTCKALWNRRRIMKILGRTKKVFDRMVAEKERTDQTFDGGRYDQEDSNDNDHDNGGWSESESDNLREEDVYPDYGPD